MLVWLAVRDWLPRVYCGVLDSCWVHVPNAPRARVAGMDGSHCNACLSATLNFVLGPAFFFRHLFFLHPTLRLSSKFCRCLLVIGFVDLGGVMFPPSMHAPRVTVTDVLALLLVAYLDGFCFCFWSQTIAGEIFLANRF